MIISRFCLWPIVVLVVLLTGMTTGLPTQIALAQIDLLNQPAITPEQRRQEFLQQQQDAETPSAPSEIVPAEQTFSPPPSSEIFDQLTIQSSDLTQGLKSVGAPHADALPIPHDVWKNFDFTLLDQLPAPIQPLLRQAWRDALLGSVYIPESNSEAQFLAYRLRGLLNLGLFHDSHRLIQKAELYGKNVNSADPWQPPLITTALLRRDWGRLCPILQSMRGTHQSLTENLAERMAWERLNTVCLIVDNSFPEAILRMQLLRERMGNDSVNDGFSLLVNMIALQETQISNNAPIAFEADNLALVMLGNVTMMDVSSTDLSVQNAPLLLRLPNLSLDDRLELAEAALQLGMIDAKVVQPVQLSMTFDEAERATISVLITRFYSARARALVVQQLASGALNEADAREVMNNALSAADQAGDFALMLMMLEPFKNQLKQARDDQLILRRAALAWGLPLVITPTERANRPMNDLAKTVMDTLDLWQGKKLAIDTHANQTSSLIDRDFLSSLIDNNPEQSEPEDSPELAEIRRWNQALEPLLTLTEPSTDVRQIQDTSGYASALFQVSQVINQTQPEALAQALKQLAYWDHHLSQRLAAWVLAHHLSLPALAIPVFNNTLQNPLEPSATPIETNTDTPLGDT